MKVSLTLNGNAFSASWNHGTETNQVMDLFSTWLEQQPSAQEVEDLAQDVRAMKQDLQLTVNEHNKE